MNRALLILDASTAILLAKVGLLREVAARGEVYMGEIAIREATVKATEDAKIIQKLIEDGAIRRVGLKGSAEKLQKDFRLHAGEAETILLAHEKGSICGTDDGPAIRCLKVLGIPFTSAIALLVALVEQNVVGGDLALELLAKLERFGRYDPRILENAAGRIRAVGGKR